MHYDSNDRLELVVLGMIIIINNSFDHRAFQHDLGDMIFYQFQHDKKKKT